jgi:hypothetical protein
MRSEGFIFRELSATTLEIRMTRALRVRRFGSRTKFEGFQPLQERRWWGRKTIDREEIPSHVIISLEAFAAAA